MRTCGRCNTSKRSPRRKAGTKKAATRWPSIWEQAGGIPFSRSFRRWKMLRDGRFGERSDRDGRAILRFWWPIRRRRTECWDGRPSAILPTSCRARGTGCGKTRTENAPIARLLRPTLPNHREWPGLGQRREIILLILRLPVQMRGFLQRRQDRATGPPVRVEDRQEFFEVVEHRGPVPSWRRRKG